MKLKNKKTGELGTLTLSSDGETFILMNERMYTHSVKLKDLEEWEDVPEGPKKFWFVDDVGEVKVIKEDDSEETEDAKQIGNYFSSREEAELAVRKLKAWKRLKDNGFKIKGWKFTPDMKHIEGNYVKIEAEIPQILINEEDINLLFSQEGGDV